jgi:hypothetical protein
MDDESHWSKWQAGSARLITERPTIWQLDFVDDHGLASYMRDKGIQCGQEKIIAYWRARILHADYILSSRKSPRAGLVQLGESRLARYRYVDERDLRPPSKLPDAFAESNILPTGMSLYFHPFRAYTIYRLTQAPTLLIGPEAWQQASDWNLTAALAIATEPFCLPYILGTVRLPGGQDDETRNRLVAEHWSGVSAWYAELGLDRVEKLRQEVCIAAELQDPNKRIHTLIRLAGSDLMLKARGALGGSLMLLLMAEILRRGAENVFGVQLPEEDEKGFGITFADAKKEIYGSVRVLDDKRARNQFIRSLGLASGPRVRWYVEGWTEYYALSSLLGQNPAIDLVNLKGNVVQRGGKGVSFRESLESDVKTEIFSFISLDGDVPDNVRVVQQAAVDDLITGMFMISQPDFEYGNFSHEELEEVLWGIAVKAGAQEADRVVLHEAIQGMSSAKALLKAAERALSTLNTVSKGREWGEDLIWFAMAHPMMLDSDAHPIERPINWAIGAALRSLRVNFQRHRAKWTVDPETGRSIERNHGRS